MSFGARLAAFLSRISGSRKALKPAQLPKRNAPCPCGSGKKFKACHLDQVLTEGRARRDEEHERKLGSELNESNAVAGKVAMANRGLRGRD